MITWTGRDRSLQVTPVGEVRTSSVTTPEPVHHVKADPIFGTDTPSPVRNYRDSELKD